MKLRREWIIGGAVLLMIALIFIMKYREGFATGVQGYVLVEGAMLFGEAPGQDPKGYPDTPGFPQAAAAIIACQSNPACVGVSRTEPSSPWTLRSTTRRLQSATATAYLKPERPPPAPAGYTSMINTILPDYAAGETGSGSPDLQEIIARCNGNPNCIGVTKDPNSTIWSQRGRLPGQPAPGGISYQKSSAPSAPAPPVAVAAPPAAPTPVPAPAALAAPTSSATPMSGSPAPVPPPQAPATIVIPAQTSPGTYLLRQVF